MEKTYKLMKFCGGAGIAIGVMSIVNGARLLVGKNHIEF